MHSPPSEPAAAPKTCPFCNSVNINTTSKEVNASTYWRCAACGQIWNAGRLQSGRRAPARFR
jgi:transposase-like protein